MDLDFVQIEIQEDEACKGPPIGDTQAVGSNGDHAVDLLAQSASQGSYLRLRGLPKLKPAKAPKTRDEVEADESSRTQEAAFFLNVSPMDVLIGRTIDGLPSGETFVRFSNEQLATAAMQAKQQQNIDGMPIEIAQTSEAEASRRSFPEGRRWREFEAIVTKDKSVSMGLDIDKVDGETMLIIKVKPGPVADYNAVQKNQSEELRRGDRIIAINEIEGSVEDMLASLADCQRVSLRCRRLVEYRLRILKKSPSEKLGIDVDHGSNEHLVVTRINHQILIKPVPGTSPQIRQAGMPSATSQSQAVEAGPVKRYNEEVSAETELRVADYIMEVNGFKGEGGKVKEMLAKISAEVLLVFLVKRAGEDTAEPEGVQV